jgi:ribosome-associated protein
MTSNGHKSKTINPKECTFSFSRSSGKGGQNVNKVNSKVLLQWRPSTTESLSGAHIQRFLKAYPSRIDSEGYIQIMSTKFRDQPRNIADCMQKLQELVDAVAEAPKRRIPTRPTKGSQERRIQEKKLHGKLKYDRKNF